jgi:uncharacterized protein
MLFAVVCIDKNDGAPLRSALVANHLAYLRNGSAVKLAGPFTDAAGNMNGSLLIIEAADRKAAEAWVANEPFAKAGLFETTDIRGWFSVINDLSA